MERLEFPHQGALQTVDRAYAYTGSDRLVSFTEPSKSQSFTYDAFGNVWQYTASGVPALRQNGASWYLQSNGVVNNRLADTAYDAAGNQTQLSVAPGTVASYDGENRMSKIKIGGAEAASYTYDAEGRRVAKTANGVTTYYFYDAAGQLMAEYGGPAQTAGTQYFTTDYLGSTRMILNGTGGCLERLDYAPFGGQIARSGMDCYGGPSSEKPLFTGQMRDGESTAGTDTGLDYFGARYYSGAQGRFTSPDPENASAFLYPDDPQSWNGYSYGRNNPLLYVDPDGMNYRVCDTEGHCRDNVTDEEWNKWREAQGKNIIVTAGGNILDRETEKKIGSAQYYNEKLAETLQDAGNRADVLIKDAAKTMAVNAAMTATGVIALRGLSYAAQSAQELGIFKNTKVLVNFAHNLMNVRPGHIPPPGGMAEAQSAVEGAIRTGNYLLKGNRLFEGTTQINGVAVGFRGRFVDGVARVATVFTKR